MGREIRQSRFVYVSATAGGLGGLALAAGGGILAVHLWTGVVLLALGVLTTAVTPVLASLRKIRSEALFERTHALSTLVELTHLLFNMETQCDLRVTLMHVDKAHTPYRLEQLARSTCDGRSNPSTTGMSIHQGVAGHCYRKTEGKVESIVVNLPDGDFVEQMVELGFEREQARNLKKRGAYLCTPIIDSMKDVIAVLCLDTEQSGALKPEHTLIAERVTPFFTNFLTAPGSGGGKDV